MAAIICACSSDPQDEKMPSVNDENCAPEGLAKIKDKGTRNQFQDMCVRRNTFKTSPKREW
jgi:entry exclusion lipoprotein TrbK